MLDMLPPLDEVVHAPPPTLSLNLAQISSLQHAYGVVYSLTVYGSRVFCGMHSGHVQQWHLPMGAPPAVLEWRAHSGTVYALCVVGRSLVTGSRDWLLRVWDLQSLTLVATLPGHRGAVRCLTSSVHAPNILYSGANDTTVRVWDVATLQGGTSKKQILRGHRKWVRALCCSADGSKLISAARDVKVWSTADLTLKHTLSVGAQVYALAVCRVNVGMAAANTLFAGSTKGRVHFWRLDELQPRGANQRGELDSGLVKKIRALSCHGHMLFCGDQAGGVCAHDISTLPAQRRPLEAHTAGVRAIDADPVSNLVFTAGDDRIVRVWGEMSFTFTEETRI
jgi:F-box/WD-40 domain protein 7